jgi:phage head maturation protease
MKNKMEVMKVNNNKPPVLYREMTFERASIDEASRVATLSFSSEAPVIRQSWFMGAWTEILRHEPNAIDMTRLRDLGVLLYMHSSYSPIGSILEPYLDETQRKCMAKARFDVDPQSDAVFQKVLSGTLRGVSVGYRVLDDDWEVVKEGKMSSCGRFAGPCEIANRWTPYEVSIVSLPADATVGVGRSNDINFEMSEYMFGRMADVISERIVKNIPFEIPKTSEKPLEEESERSGPPPKLQVMRRRLDLISRMSAL